MTEAPMLKVRGLRTTFRTRQGAIKAVDGVDLDIGYGECLGVVGESGSGKSVAFASIMGLVRPPGRIEAGSIMFEDRELTTLEPREMQRLRGKEIAMTFQDALTALNPAFTVGNQIAETIITHDKSDGSKRVRIRRARARAVEMMTLVGIPDASRRVNDYPHQFSGGMRQRIMIAIALACRPKLLIADEPTTALDVTIQAQVLDLIAEIRATLGMSVVIITHDLGVVAEHCHRVLVMYAGQVVETGPTENVVAEPRHPYTSGLLRSIPRLNNRNARILPIKGTVPEPINLPDECRFRPRCPVSADGCRVPIAMRSIGHDREARCIFAGDEP
ncbi:MAG: ABC transporter ATP-binding protein [Albidovulum sp.]|nr:ABC transporter ATP-binding protein [Albidovulum sp.]